MILDNYPPPENKFTILATVPLSRSKEAQLLKFLNLHYLGDEDANHYVDGRLVAKYPERETQEFKEAVHRAGMDLMVKLFVEFDVNGKPTFQIIPFDQGEGRGVSDRVDRTRGTETQMGPDLRAIIRKSLARELGQRIDLENLADTVAADIATSWDWDRIQYAVWVNDDPSKYLPDPEELPQDLESFKEGWNAHCAKVWRTLNT